MKLTLEQIKKLIQEEYSKLTEAPSVKTEHKRIPSMLQYAVIIEDILMDTVYIESKDPSLMGLSEEELMSRVKREMGSFGYDHESFDKQVFKSALKWAIKQGNVITNHYGNYALDPSYYRE